MPYLRETYSATQRDKLIEKLAVKTLWACVYCLLDLKKNREKASIEHKVQLYCGGSNDEENLVLACRKCNQGRSAQTFEQYRAEKSNR